ncbi:coiled-coil domain-containing protein 43 isoform X2 [Agrilus planipennis]|uniref:Coiled-coil domain-containing protein 43 n=1 Tax=Agrilus planipennis TaxID=224129 RepID=A0A1W4X4L0_AGRPL|nr:coiled-coil domain-containing protein 43 isoform X2 [Agrilus planipennis]
MVKICAYECHGNFSVQRGTADGRKLQDLNADENIFGSYIIGILEGDETPEEKLEALEGIFTDTSNDCNLLSICTEIIDMWSVLKQPTHIVDDAIKNVDINLTGVLDSHSLQIPKQKQYTDEEKKIREAILSQYSQMTDDEDEVECDASSNGKESVITKNTNALAVQVAEKEKREQAKLESLKKKEKDKEGRERQKQAREEKKEKRKTQKGERKR